MYCGWLLLFPFETKVRGTDEVKGGGAKVNVGVVVVVGRRRGCGSGGLLSVVALDSASLILVCTLDASTYMYMYIKYM